MFKKSSLKKIERKPFQNLAWFATICILMGALSASIVPELYVHHFFFVLGNGLLAITAYLWRESSLLVLNTFLCVIYIIGITAKSL